MKNDDRNTLKLPFRLDNFGNGAARLIDCSGGTIAEIHNGDMLILEMLVSDANKKHGHGADD